MVTANRVAFGDTPRFTDPDATMAWGPDPRCTEDILSKVLVGHGSGGC